MRYGKEALDKVADNLIGSAVSSIRPLEGTLANVEMERGSLLAFLGWDGIALHVNSREWKICERNSKSPISNGPIPAFYISEDKSR